MKTRILCAALLLAASALSVRAQTADPSNLVVPTTKLLAIGTFTAKATPSLWQPLLRAEMTATARIYLAGKIDQWYIKQDQTGVVFIFGLADPQEARALLDQLPFSQAGLMAFQITPLGPLSPLRTLLSEPSK